MQSVTGEWTLSLQQTIKDANTILRREGNPDEMREDMIIEIERLQAEVNKLTAERDALRDDVEFFERGHFRAGSLAKMERERDEAKAALRQAQEDLREARNEWESAVERSRSTEHILHEARDSAYAAGRQEGIGEALDAVSTLERASHAGIRNDVLEDAMKAIRDLLVVPAITTPFARCSNGKCKRTFAGTSAGATCPWCLWPLEPEIPKAREVAQSIQPPKATSDE